MARSERAFLLTSARNRGLVVALATLTAAAAVSAASLAAAAQASRSSPQPPPDPLVASADEPSSQDDLSQAPAATYGDSPSSTENPAADLVFRPPVDAPITDPFRAPEDPYGPGNRGIEYDTTPGQLVRAAAAGTVSFAGAVAGSLYVTIDHGGGLRSSYSYLQRLTVTEGSRVAQGQVIAVAGERLHFGARLDERYIDPQTYLATRNVRVRLIPIG